MVPYWAELKVALEKEIEMRVRDSIARIQHPFDEKYESANSFMFLSSEIIGKMRKYLP